MFGEHTRRAAYCVQCMHSVFACVFACMFCCFPSDGELALTLPISEFAELKPKELITGCVDAVIDSSRYYVLKVKVRTDTND
jgi:wyosine [tRNA(Phe)-imidazoG37] synthetase (radical SAM superfamily)